MWADTFNASPPLKLCVMAVSCCQKWATGGCDLGKVTVISKAFGLRQNLHIPVPFISPHPSRSICLTKRRNQSPFRQVVVPVASQTSDPTRDGVTTETSAESLRLVPLIAGAAGGSAVLINRILGGVAPVSDASR